MLWLQLLFVRASSTVQWEASVSRQIQLSSVLGRETRSTFKLVLYFIWFTSFFLSCSFVLQCWMLKAAKREWVRTWGEKSPPEHEVSFLSLGVAQVRYILHQLWLVTLISYSVASYRKSDVFTQILPYHDLPRVTMYVMCGKKKKTEFRFLFLTRCLIHIPRSQANQYRGLNLFIFSLYFTGLPSIQQSDLLPQA